MLKDQSKFIVAGFLMVSFLSYSGYLYSHLPIADNQLDKTAEKGKAIWQQYNCSACHQVYGLGGYLGPDLTNAYSKRGPIYIQAFITNGTNIMPNNHLSESEIAELIKYLKTIDASGKSDPKTFTIQNNGFIHQ
ncbi:MAG: cytochrome c [Sediminibacterium sp.]|nr:cytochrome c [Sediminibacterium sp.]